MWGRGREGGGRGDGQETGDFGFAALGVGERVGVSWRMRRKEVRRG